MADSQVNWSDFTPVKMDVADKSGNVNWDNFSPVSKPPAAEPPSIINESAKSFWQSDVSGVGHLIGGALKFAGDLIDPAQVTGLKSAGQWFVDNADSYLATQKPASTEGMGLPGKLMVKGAGFAGGMLPIIAAAPALAPLGVVGSGVAMGAAFVPQFYEDTKEEVLKGGGTPEDARKAGTIAAALGFITFSAMAPATRMLTGVVGGGTAEEVGKALTEERIVQPFLKEAAIAQGIAIPAMGIQGAGQQAITNEYNPNPITHGSVPEAALESMIAATGFAIISTPGGLLARIQNANRAKQFNQALNNTDAPDEVRTGAASLIMGQMANVDQKAAEEWGKNASIAIANKQPISMENLAGLYGTTIDTTGESEKAAAELIPPNGHIWEKNAVHADNVSAILESPDTNIAIENFDKAVQATSADHNNALAALEEFTTLAASEKADVEARRAAIPEAQKTARESALETITGQIEGNRQTATRDNRQALMDKIYSDQTVTNPAQAFLAAVGREFPNQPNLSSAEKMTIANRENARKAFAAGEQPLPSLPNESEMGIKAAAPNAPVAATTDRIKVAQDLLNTKGNRVSKDGTKILDANGKKLFTFKEGEQNAVQIEGTARQVPRTIEGGENIPESGAGVRPGIERESLAGEGKEGNGQAIGNAAQQINHEVAGLPVQEVPIKDLTLSKEVPQFKAGANEQGIVSPLGGKFDRTRVGAIQVWERNNGDREVISGRNRFDLAKRSGEETIPAQIHSEANGFDAAKAATLDAELNIRDEQGSVADYANYFKESGIDQNTANSEGLLARAKGKAGFSIAHDASEDVYASHRAGIISDEAALAITRAAPSNDALQAVGLKMVNEGKSITLAENTMRAVGAMQKAGEVTQGDIFGFDDSAMKQAQEMARKASSAQRIIREQIAAVSGATKRPELARNLGVDVKNPKAVLQKIIELRAEQKRLDNWPVYPDLVAKFRTNEAISPEAKPIEKSSTKLSKDEINAELDKLTSAAKQRLKEAGVKAPSTMTAISPSELEFMTDAEKTRRHELVQMLPSFGEEAKAASERVKKRIEDIHTETPAKLSKGIESATKANQAKQAEAQRREEKPAAETVTPLVTKQPDGRIRVTGFSRDQVIAARDKLGITRVAVDAKGQAIFPDDTNIIALKQELGVSEIPEGTILADGGKPFDKRGKALLALKTNPAIKNTHEIIKVEDGYGIAPKKEFALKPQTNAEIVAKEQVAKNAPQAEEQTAIDRAVEYERNKPLELTGQVQERAEGKTSQGQMFTPEGKATAAAEVKELTSKDVPKTLMIEGEKSDGTTGLYNARKALLAAEQRVERLKLLRDCLG